MKQDRFYCQAPGTKSGLLRPAPASLWRRVGLFMAILALGALFSSTPMRSLSDPASSLSAQTYTEYRVFLYNGNGSATDVTDYVFYVGSQAYIYPNNPMAVVLDYAEGHVYDPYGHVIGYITYSTPPVNWG